MHIRTFADQASNHRDYTNGSLTVDSSPAIENLEIIAKCNLSCSICIRPPRRGKYIMELDDVKRLVSANRDLLAGQHIWLHHYGEPLLHPHIGKIIEYLEGEGINTRLSTNATLLNNKNARIILDSGLQEIVFSIDGVSSGDYERIRVNASYESVLSNVMGFLDMKSELDRAKPETQVQLVNVTGDESYAQRFIDLWKQTRVDWINIKNPSTRALGIRDTDMRMRFAERRKGFKGACYWPWSTMIILSDGNIVPCCSDLSGRVVVGNACASSLLDVWNGARMRKVRSDHLGGSYESCRVCARCPENNGYSMTFEEKAEYEAARAASNQVLTNHRLIRNG